MRERYVWDPQANGGKGGVVPAAERPRRSATGPNVISDGLPGLMNHADGRRYSSKRAFERAVRQAGCEIVGNEKQPERRPAEPTGVGADIVRAIRQLGG